MKKNKIDKREWIEKKDLFYWILIILLLWLLSSDYGKNNPLVLDNWTFTGTIVSIILAILAIVYTYAQNSTTLMTTNKLSESAEKIEEVTRKIEDTSIDVLFTQLESKVNEIISVIDTSLKEEMDKHKDFLNEFMKSKNFKSPFEDSFEIMSEEQWNKYIEEINKDNSLISELLYHIYIKNKKNLSYNYYHYANWIVNNTEGVNDKDGFSSFIATILNGAQYVLESLNVFTTEDLDSKLTVKEVSPALMSSIENNLDKFGCKTKIDRFIEDL